MGVLICPDCNKEVSDTLSKCPHCGRSIDFNSTVQKNAFDNNDISKANDTITINYNDPRIALFMFPILIICMYYAYEWSNNKMLRELQEKQSSNANSIEKEYDIKKDIGNIRKSNTDVKFQELASYTSGGKSWNNILVSSSITKDEIIILAKYLHNYDPMGLYRIFDNDKQFKKFVEADTHYPDSNYPYPEKWANKHYIAIINKMFDKGKLRWQLNAMGLAGLRFAESSNSTLIADLE